MRIVSSGTGNLRQKVYYYHNDHLGTPQQITDQNQKIVWAANYKPFGEAVITTETITNNLRFAGQYFDAESGLHYNYHRYYDPGLGRYITSDPIGLEGGLNTYAYVGGNPLNRIDPLGLDFRYSQDAESYVKSLRSKSITASRIMDAMKADKKTDYSVDVGPVNVNSGGGETTYLQQRKRSLLERLLGAPPNKATVYMRVDPNSGVEFTDTCGEKFIPQTERLLGHELGHGYIYEEYGYIGIRQKYDDAIKYENEIARQLDPNAPVRAVNDHGSNLPW